MYIYNVNIGGILISKRAVDIAHSIYMFVLNEFHT